MIGYLKGTVRHLAPGEALLEVGGVGYEVICSGAAFSRLSRVKEGGTGEVYTCFQVREDGVYLYGFADPKEKELFCELTSVQGVGGKSAIGILSAMKPEEVSEAIATGDSKRFSAVKGVGKKTAERIILELHGKLSEDAITGFVPPADEEDALSALMGLGFTKQESTAAVERARKSGARGVEEIIAAALRTM